MRGGLVGKHVLLCLVESLYHGDNLFPTVNDVLRLLEQVVEHFWLIELLEQFSLKVLFRVVDQGERDGLRDHVNHLALDDIEVRVDEKLC